MVQIKSRDILFVCTDVLVPQQMLLFKFFIQKCFEWCAYVILESIDLAMKILALPFALLNASQEESQTIF